MLAVAKQLSFEGFFFFLGEVLELRGFKNASPCLFKSKLLSS
jgi:hypothetical protein